MNHFIIALLNNSVLHTFPALDPYGYVVFLSKVDTLFSSLLLSTILLTFSVYTSCLSLLNLCCDFNTTFLFNRQSL